MKGEAAEKDWVEALALPHNAAHHLLRPSPVVEVQTDSALGCGESVGFFTQGAASLTQFPQFNLTADIADDTDAEIC